MREERRWPRGQCTELLSVPGKDPHVASFLREVSKGNGKLLGKLKEFLRVKCVGLVLLSGGVHRGYAVVTWCQNNRDKLPQRGRLRSREGAYRSTIFKFKLWKFSKIFMLQEDPLQNVSFHLRTWRYSKGSPPRSSISCKRLYFLFVDATEAVINFDNRWPQVTWVLCWTDLYVKHNIMSTHDARGSQPNFDC